VELQRRYQNYNPVILQQEVHRAVAALMELNQQKTLKGASPSPLAPLRISSYG
jgi:hypothetical protein